ncbi:MAG: helix-turn-helix domain-containing protein [Balneolaceae bacterium]
MEALELPTRKEQQAARESKEKLDRISGKLKKSTKEIELGVRGEKDHFKIPVSAFRFLSTILEHMADGKAISIIPADTEITTQQAADMLNVSRPHVVKLLEEKALPFHKVGTHRRIKLKDLEAYRAKMEKDREEALTELTRISQELDLDY